ncbi:MAG: MerR family transcriptional regulator, partial [Bacteroidales bacterium]|nr:MerR family transcriptional regulator [Bacteroidales bacterium]
TYIEAFKYIEEKGLEIAGLARNVFVDGVWNHDDPEKWVSIIQIPVK